MLAARFAADYLSWDANDPQQRAAALSVYVTAADVDDVSQGWTVADRVCVDLVLPGRITRVGRAVVVEVIARVVRYDRPPGAGQGPPAGPVALPGCVGPAAATAAPDGQWRARPAQWVRVAPLVRRERTGQLVVDVDDDTSLD